MEYPNLQHPMANLTHEASTAPIHTEELLLREFSWISLLIDHRIGEMTDNLSNQNELTSPPEPPPITPGLHPYYDELIAMEANAIERLSLTLCLSVQTMPEFADALHSRNKQTGLPFTEFGVNVESPSNRLKITWQTVAFLLLGPTSGIKVHLIEYMHPDHRMYRQRLLAMPEKSEDQLFLAPLVLHTDALRKWLMPSHLRYLAPPDFKADELTTSLEWGDLFLEEETRRSLKLIELWLEHSQAIRQDYKKQVSPGMKALFYGPSGTGKTLAATLLGKRYGRPVYRVDLSQIVSKWIGETEKNLARIFDVAEGQQWILFFDEADALFSARVSGSTANDRRANQEIAYLLQRIESFEGTIIMASNLRHNIDEAFVRRFQLMTPFPMPGPDLRERMWQHLLNPYFELAPELDLAAIAEDFELAGGHMKNIFLSLVLLAQSPENGGFKLNEATLRNAINFELTKQGHVQVPTKY